MIFLITFLSFIVSRVLCSHHDFNLSLNNEETYDFSAVSKTFDDLISKALGKALAVSDRNQSISIFEDLYQSMTFFSIDNQKIINFEAFFEFMKHKSDEIIILSNVNKLSKQEKEHFIRKVSISVNEINFVKSLENFVFSENCAEHILQAVKKLDPSLEIKDILSSVLTLAEYCSSDACQDLIFSLILKYLEKPNNQLPFFNINPQIKETSIMDSFFESCYILMNSKLDHQNFHNILIRIIIEGPYSFKSTNTLLKLFNESREMFKSISEAKINSSRLAIRLMKSNYFEYFLGLFSNSTKHESDTIFELKTALELKQTDLETILRISNPEHLVIQGVNAAEIKNYACDFKKFQLENAAEIKKYSAEMNCNYNYKILEFYLRIDPEFIKSVTIDLNTKIVRIINEFKNLKSLDEKIVHLFSAYIYINLIPKDKSFYVTPTQYEPILDFTIELIAFGIDLDFTFHLIRNVISLPFVEVTDSALEKFWYVHNLKYGRDLFTWNISSISLILTKFKDFNDALELFKKMFYFFESKQLDFNTIAALLVARFNNPYLREAFNFCKHHKLLHMLQIETIEKSFKSSKSYKKEMSK